MLGVKKEKKATAPCHSPQVLWVLVPSLLGKVILNGGKKNPGRGRIDPAHYFTQSSTFTIKLWTRDTVIVAHLRLNTGFFRRSRANFFTYNILSPFGPYHKCHHMQRRTPECRVVEKGAASAERLLFVFGLKHRSGRPRSAVTLGATSQPVDNDNADAVFFLPAQLLSL